VKFGRGSLGGLFASVVVKLALQAAMIVMFLLWLFI